MLVKSDHWSVMTSIFYASWQWLSRDSGKGPSQHLLLENLQAEILRDGRWSLLHAKSVLLPWVWLFPIEDCIDTWGPAWLTLMCKANANGMHRSAVSKSSQNISAIHMPTSFLFLKGKKKKIILYFQHMAKYPNGFFYIHKILFWSTKTLSTFENSKGLKWRGRHISPGSHKASETGTPLLQPVRFLLWYCFLKTA